MSTDSQGPTLHVVLIGDSHVGKTSIVNTYKTGSFVDNQSETIGAVLYDFKREINGKTVTLHVSDTAGQEKYRSLGPIYYRGAECALAVFDLTSRESFLSLKNWIELFHESTDNAFVYIVANKSDLSDNWAVSFDDATLFAAEYNAPLHYTSALTSEGLDPMFNELFKTAATYTQEQQTTLKKNESKGCC